MSHTSCFEVDRVEYAVIHNGDWSGPARIVWEDTSGKHEIELPGRLLTKISRYANLCEVVSAVETLMGKDPAGH